MVLYNQSLRKTRNNTVQTLHQLIFNLNYVIDSCGEIQDTLI